MEKHLLEQAYRYYVTSALQHISKNTAVHEGNRYLDKSFYDLLNNQPVEEKAGIDIVNDVAERMGLVVLTNDTA